MRRLVVTIAIVVSVVSVGGIAVAGDAFESSRAPGEERFHLYAQSLPGDLIIPAAGGPPVAGDDEEYAPSVGDVNMFREALFRADRNDQPTGDQIGTGDILCTFTRVDLEAFSADLLCDAVYTLPGGQITAKGLVTFAEESPPVFAVAITGGTRQYADAGGQILIRELEEGDDTLYQFRVEHR